MATPKAALLPLFLSLYDKTDPSRRTKFDGLIGQVAKGLQDHGIEVLQGPICCVEAEFRDAVSEFEQRNADAIVLLHLAYSPSLESADVFAASDLPLVFFDTTMDAAFGPDADPSRIGYCHGIHGVQDLTAVLRRKGKTYSVVAGHIESSDVVARASAAVRAAAAARAFRAMKVLRIGTPFHGMGDFAIPDDRLRDAFGIAVDTVAPGDLAPYVQRVDTSAVAAERNADTERYDITAAPEVYDRATRIGLGLRTFLEEGGYGAFSMNFASFTDPNGDVNAVPFLEACKAMERGLGYAGEGDVLTAPLVGALSRAFGDTNFTEMFCPDWVGNSVFMFHMGEVNPGIAAARPRIVELDFPYTDAQNPTAMACDYRPGTATLVNLTPGPGNTFDLIVAPVEVFGEAADAGLQECVRGWIRPKRPLHAFLEAYSAAGGTHHVALVYGDQCEAMGWFGHYLGLPVTVIA